MYAKKKRRAVTFVSTMTLFAALAVGQPLPLGVNENISLIGRWGEGPCLTSDAVGSVAYFGNGAYLEIVDFSTPASPVELGDVLLPGPIYDIAVVGDYAYVADGFDGLRIVDVSSPAAPVEVAFLDTPDEARAVDVIGSYAYIADWGSGGLRIVDVSNPAAPVEVGNLPTPGAADDVAVVGSYAYVADYHEGLRIIDVSTPAAPFEVGSLDTAWWAYGLAVSGNFVYVADFYDGVRVIDVSNPAAPIEVGFYDPGTAVSVVIEGSTLFVAAYSAGLRVVDVSVPATPVEIGFYDPGSPTLFAWHVVVEGNQAYIADDNNALRIIDVSSPAAPVEVGSYDVSDETRGIAVSGQYAYAANMWDGLQILDLSNPSEPPVVGTLDTATAQDVVVEGSYAYLADGISGLRIIDVSVPTAPLEVANLDLDHRSEAIDVDSGYAYLAGYSSSGNPGLYVVDVSVPTAPFTAAFMYTPGSQCRDVVVSGNYAYVAAYTDGLIIYDVSNPSIPIETGSVYSGPAHGVAVEGSYAFVAAGGNKLSVIDVSDPSAPFEAGLAGMGGVATGIDVGGGFAYVANAEHGLRIFDVTEPTTPTQVGLFDTGDYARKVVLNEGRAFVADGADGVWILGLSVLHTAVNPANGHTYHLLGSFGWTAAEALALTLGGHLVTINDQTENDWVIANFGQYPSGTDNDLLLGLHDSNLEGSFEWSSGEPLTFTDWAPGEPDDSGGGEDYARIESATGSGQWGDYSGTAAAERHGVVEVSFDPGFAYCFGDGGGTTCPCGSNAGSGEGCQNTTGAGAILIASGDAELSNDTFALAVLQAPANKPGICVKGSVQLVGGHGNQVGDGLLCTTPQLRSQVIVSDAGGSVIMDNWNGLPFGSYPAAANVGSSTYYQWWYRDPANTCSGQGFNFANAWCVFWMP